MKQTTALIAGCGDVGGALAKQLIESNHSDVSFAVWGLRRTVAMLPSGVKPIAADLTCPETFQDWPEHIDYVVYSAATDGRSPEQYRQAYIDGLRNVINHLELNQLQPKRLLFTSSTSVYHQGNGEWVDETSPCHPESFSGQTILEAEALLQSCTIPATAVRFGGIYGPGRNRLINRALKGEGCAQKPVIYSNRIHRDDCAGILAHLILMDIEDKPVDPVYLGVDCNPAPIHDVLHWIAQQRGVELDDSHPAPPRSSKRCSNQRILDSGYTFRYPDYQTGYSLAHHQS